MWWYRLACVTPRWIVVSSRCSGSRFRMWGAGVPMSASPTDFRGCTRSWRASREVVKSWRMVDASSMVVGSPAFAGLGWRVAVVRRLSSAKLMRGERSGYQANPGYTRASSNASGMVTRT